MRERERGRKKEINLNDVEWQFFKNMERTLVQIWSVTRRATPRTRRSSDPLDVRRSGQENRIPTGRGIAFSFPPQLLSINIVALVCLTTVYTFSFLSLSLFNAYFSCRPSQRIDMFISDLFAIYLCV